MKHKDHYDDAYVAMLAEKIAPAAPWFDAAAFCEDLAGKLDDKELFARFDCIVDALAAGMGGDYGKNIEAFTAILGPELAGPEGMFTHGYWLWPLGRYVERFGTADWRLSLAFLQELTKRFTGEYAIRPLLAQYPKEVMEELVLWARDENVHVRRLAAEGVRIRLPWGLKLLVAVEQFDLYSQILTALKDDPTKFVQKSVGNNLNDLYREAPEKADAIIAAWQQGPSSPAQEWIIKHGRRNQKAAPGAEGEA